MLPSDRLNTSNDPSIGSGPLTAAAYQRLSTCRAMVDQMRIIAKTLGDRFAANPEFAMLMDLYVAGLERRETCLWEVCNATTIPMTTAHRKLGRLVEQGYVERVPALTDHRRIGLNLTSEAIAKFDALMDSLVHPVLPRDNQL